MKKPLLALPVFLGFLFLTLYLFLLKTNPRSTKTPHTPSGNCPIFRATNIQKVAWGKERRACPNYRLTAEKLEAFLEGEEKKAKILQHLHSVSFSIFAGSKQPLLAPYQECFSTFAVYSSKDSLLLFPKLTIYGYDNPGKTRPVQTIFAENATIFTKNGVEISAPSLKIMQ